MTRTNKSKPKIISFLSEVKRKNITQIELINELGLHVDYFVTAGFESGKRIIGSENNIFLLEDKFFNRLKQVYIHCKKHKQSINHIEIFGGGRFGFVYAFLAKWFGFKILLVERGVMNEYINPKNRYTALKFSAFLQYKLADICWFKEYYMQIHLEKLKVKRLNFIPNAIGKCQSGTRAEFSKRTIDFLWVNRVIPIRHIDWVIQMAQLDEFANKRFELYGFLDDQYANDKKSEIVSLGLKNVHLYDYADDVDVLYKKSKYFLLPADYVFGNNSLLEAMVFGVVPIITNVYGSDKLIQNRVNGIISENTWEAYLIACKEVLKIPALDWETMSKNAISTVLQSYSLQTFKERLRLLYHKIENL